MYSIFTALFSVLYFVRFPDLSVYVYDAFFILTFFFVLKSLYIDRVQISLIAIFIVVSLSIGFYSSAFSVHDFRISDFFARLYRYFFILSIPMFFLERLSSTSERNNLVFFYFCSLIPVLYNNIMLLINAEVVMVFGRASSYLDNPNTFGSYLCAVVVPFSVVTFVSLRSKIYSIFGLISAVYSLVYVGSNSYWLLSFASFIASFFIMLGISLLKKNLKYLIWCSLFLCLSGLFIYSNLSYFAESDISGLKRTAMLAEVLLSSNEVNELGSGEFRERISEVAWSIINSNYFVIGTGYGQSPEIISHYLGGTVTAHNSFIVALLENGLLGFFIFYLGLFFPFLKAMFNKLYSLHSRKVLLVFFVSYLFTCLATPNVYLPFTLLGIIYGYMQLDLRNRVSN